MALPIIGWTLSGFLWSVATAIVAGIAKFLTSKLGEVAAGLGLGAIVIYGWTALLGYVVEDISYISESIGSIDTGVGGSGGSINVLEIMAYIGFFDALNIIFSGVMVAVVLNNIKVAMGWTSSIVKGFDPRA